MTGPLVRFVCATGLRCPGEVIDLKWPMIERHTLSLRVGSKTSAGHRTVPLSAQALAALDELPRSMSGYLFPGKRGGRFDYTNWRDTEWRAALEGCGLPHRTPYEMRHTFATLALAHGASIDDVATVMGHDDIAVAYRYYRKWVKLMADRLRLTLDQIVASDDSVHCPKEMRNGPCGGVRADGCCEVDATMRCVWVEAVEGSARMRDGRRAIALIQRPLDRQLEGRSSWLAVARAASAHRDARGRTARIEVRAR